MTGEQRRTDDRRMERLEDEQGHIRSDVSDLSTSFGRHEAGCEERQKTILSRLGRLEGVAIAGTLALLSMFGSTVWYLLTHSVRVVVGP